MTHDLLGPYVLGVLAPPEQREFERHLARCAVCRAELAGLPDVVDGLSRLGAEEVGPLAAVGLKGLADGVVAAVAADRRRELARSRRFQAALTAAAAVAVLVGGVATATGLARERPSGPPTESARVTASAGLQATAAVIAHTWGVEIVLTAEGFDEGQRYDVSVLARDGSRSSAGAFVGTGGRTMVCRLNSAVLRGDAVSFRVTDSSGTQRLAGTVG